MNTAHAELRKLLALPSLRLTALLTWTANLLLTLAYASAESRGEPLGNLALAPLGYTQAGFLVLGVLATASEYQAGGQIHTTLLAMPRRLPLQAAKALTLAAVTLPLRKLERHRGTDLCSGSVRPGYLFFCRDRSISVWGMRRVRRLR